MNKQTKVAALLLLAALCLGSCTKEDDEPITPRRWVKVYNNITLGDDENSSEGQFLKSRTGQVVKLQDAAPVRSELVLVYNVTYGNTSYLSSPADMDAADPYEPYEGPIYNAPGAGIDFWASNEKNSVEMHTVAMPAAEYDQLANGSNWQNFDAAFRKYNDGDADLSFTAHEIYNPGVGEVYLIQINASLRCIARVTAASSSQTTGFLSFKLIIEGREDMGAEGRALMPAE